MKYRRDCPITNTRVDDPILDTTQFFGNFFPIYLAPLSFAFTLCLMLLISSSACWAKSMARPKSSLLLMLLGRLLNPNPSESFFLGYGFSRKVVPNVHLLFCFYLHGIGIVKAFPKWVPKKWRSLAKLACVGTHVVKTKCLLVCLGRFFLVQKTGTLFFTACCIKYSCGNRKMVCKLHFFHQSFALFVRRHSSNKNIIGQDHGRSLLHHGRCKLLINFLVKSLIVVLLGYTKSVLIGFSPLLWFQMGVLANTTSCF